jgi:zinc protease
VLGGNFTSRLNMNLREDKHWSYGVHSMLAGARAQRPFLAVAPVQTDKTKESISELLKEFKGILSDKPITPEELKKTQVNQTLRLPGAWETAGRVAGSIAEIVRYNLPDDYFAVYPNKVRALTQEDVRKAAQTVVHPEKMIWVVVGDRAKIESGIRELNLGELHLLDADGNPVK